MITHLRKIQNNFLQGGFTLVEMMVYLAIFLVLTTASVTFLISLDDFIDQYRLETMLYRSGTNTMEQLLLSIREADQIDLLNTNVSSSTNGRLTVENTSTTTEFTLTGGDIEMIINGQNYGGLTMEGVIIEGFTIYNYDLSVGDLVRIVLEISADLDGTTQKNITLYGGAMIRGSI